MEVRGDKVDCAKKKEKKKASIGATAADPPWLVLTRIDDFH